MNYHNITSPDMLNGEGLRTVLWVSGCSHNCPGCHNPETHPVDSGIPFTESTLDELLRKSDHKYIHGLTLSGGDPFNPYNVYTCKLIAEKFTERFPDKNIWVYTGYLFDDLIKRSDIGTKGLLNKSDVVIDGGFIESLKSPGLKYRGSSNQRVIDSKLSITWGVVVERGV